MIVLRKSLSHIWISSILEMMISRFPSKKIIFQWELTGILFIFMFGSFFHFLFEMAGNWPPVALIAAVNESVWEHLKLAFWPALLYALIELPFLKDRTKNFWTAKAFGILSMPIIIVSIFYGYTAFIGHHILWVDIALFGFSATSGQAISCLLMIQQPFSSALKRVGTIILIIMITAFSLLTYLPPKFPLFRESASGHYGLMK